MTASLKPNIGFLNTAVHDTGRPCVHTLTPPPDAFYVLRAAVARLNRQSRLITHHPPCIAARIGTTLVLGFDAIGPIETCYVGKGKNRTVKINHRFEYVLTAVDDRDDVMLALR